MLGRCLQDEESNLVQVKRHMEDVSAGVVQSEEKLQSDSNHLSMFGRTNIEKRIELSEEMQEILDQHNIYRCMHVVPLLEWDTSIAFRAQSWVDKSVWKHSSAVFRKQGSENCGEYLLFRFQSRF